VTKNGTRVLYCENGTRVASLYCAARACYFAKVSRACRSVGGRRNGAVYSRTLAPGRQHFSQRPPPGGSHYPLTTATSRSLAPQPRPAASRPAASRPAASRRSRCLAGPPPRLPPLRLPPLRLPSKGVFSNLTVYQLLELTHTFCRHCHGVAACAFHS